MATSARLYRTPQPTSTTHRGRILTVPEFAEISALDADLAALCAEGLLEAVLDEHGMIRYRPIANAQVA